MIYLMISNLSTSVLEWTLANIPAIGIMMFIGWSIWKYISWLDSKFSAIDNRFAATDMKIDTLRSDMNLEFVKVKYEISEVRAEMTLGFAKVEAEIKLINHRLDDHDERISHLLKQ